MPDQTFIDGVGDVRLFDGVVRMDLLVRSATRRNKADGQPAVEIVSQLVMSPRAFLRVADALGRTLREMKEKGLVTGDGESDGATAAPADETADAAAAVPAAAAEAPPEALPPLEPQADSQRVGASPNF